MTRSISQELCWLAAVWALTTQAHAANVDPSEWALLTEGVKRAAAVPVLVDLADFSLVELRYQGESVRAKSARYAARLLDELGAETWRESSTVSPAGQVTTYVTAHGLHILKNSSNALSFRAGKEWYQTTRLHREGEALAALRRRAADSGSVDVSVTMNVEGMGFSHSASGKTQYRLPPGAVDELPALAQKLHNRLGGIPGGKAALAIPEYLARHASGGFDPTLTIKVTERELAALGTSDTIRDIRAIDEAKEEYGPPYVSPSTDAAAEANGKADVLVFLRSPIKRGNASDRSNAAHRESVLSIIDDIRSRFGGLPGLTALPEVNALTGYVTREELKQLKTGSDTRIAAISHNYPIGEAAAHTSNAQMNTQLVWSTATTNGYITGSGAVVAILDTGIKKNHQAMLNKYGTASRVVREACFGTTDSVHISPCPGSQDSNFDSFGPGSGEPAHCYGSSSCSHGTSVAGIAAGGGVFVNANTGTSFRSMAYNADIWSYQVFSRQRGTTNAFALAADVLAALNKLIQEMPSSGVVEITVSKSNYPSTCTGAAVTAQDRAVYEAVQAAVSTLYDRGIAVVAPTGNDNYVGEIGFPACIEKVVKVLAMPNNGLYLTMPDGQTIDGQYNSFSSNLPGPVHIATGYVWIAPGGDKKAKSSVGTPNPTTTVWMPAADSTSAYVASKGTSYAAPHIAGAFALYKSASNVSSTVAEAANYFLGAGRALRVWTHGVTTNSAYYTYNAIRFKSL